MPVDPKFSEYYSEKPRKYRLTEVKDERAYFRDISVILGEDEILSLPVNSWMDAGKSDTYMVTIRATTQEEHDAIEEHMANPGDW